VSRFRFIGAEKVQHPVGRLCRLLSVSASGFYGWRRRLPSPRNIADLALALRIRAIHERSRGTYGAPRVHAELLAGSERVSRPPRWSASTVDPIHPCCHSQAVTLDQLRSAARPVRSRPTDCRCSAFDGRRDQGPLVEYVRTRRRSQSGCLSLSTLTRMPTARATITISETA
jgi:hypothetical protein